MEKWRSASCRPSSVTGRRSPATLFSRTTKNRRGRGSVLSEQRSPAMPRSIEKATAAFHVGRRAVRSASLLPLLLLAAAWITVASASASASPPPTPAVVNANANAARAEDTGEDLCEKPSAAPLLPADATLLSDLRSYFDAPPPSSDDERAAATAEALPPPVQSRLRSRLASLGPFLSRTRRELHRFPELMYQEKETSRYIQKVLRELDVPHTTGWGKNARPEAFEGPGGYGIVGHIGSGSGPCVILRADMDGLPVSEEAEHDFKSDNVGRMHACGHDGHVTMLLGAAAVLKSIEGEIRGTVRLVFQPAEEGGAGGKRMVEEGVAELEPRARHAFGMHIWPTMPLGQIGTRVGPLLGAYERFTATVTGVGGHAAMPHLTSDPIVASASIVTALQTLVSRRLSPLESGVVSVTHIRSGSGAYNVIPPDAEIRGTIRALSTDTLLSLRGQAEDMIKTVAKAHGCDATLEYAPDYYPPTVNDQELYPAAVALAGGVGEVVEVEPTMGAEDFGFFAEAVPSMFFLLGQKQEEEEEVFGLHHPKFDIREDALAKGAELHVTMALGMLKKLADEGK